MLNRLADAFWALFAPPRDIPELPVRNWALWTMRVVSKERMAWDDLLAEPKPWGD